MNLPVSRLLRYFLPCVFCLSALAASAQTATTTTVSASPGSAPYGTALSLAASVTAPTAPANAATAANRPTGTVQFFDGGNSLSAAPAALGPGEGFYTTPFSQFFGPLDAAFTGVSGQLAADVNGDGIQDLLVYMNVETGSVQQASVTVQSFLANTKGGYSGLTAQTLSLPFPPPANTLVLFAPVLADVNGDGKLDLLIGPSVAYGNGDGTFQQPVVLSFLATGYLNTFAGDVNGDGKADILAVNTTPNLGSNAVLPLQITVFLNQGSGNFRSAQTVTIASGQCACELLPLTSLNLADLNGDGKLDIVAQSLFIQPDIGLGPVPTQIITSLLNNGDGTFAGAVEATYTPQNPGGGGGAPYDSTALLSMQVADFNGDGKMDVALIYPTETLVGGFTTAMIFLPGKGDGTFGTETISNPSYPMAALGPEPAAPGENAVAVDVNLDGFPDLVFGSAAVALADGKGNFAAGNPITTNSGGTFGESLGLLLPAGSSLPYLVFAGIPTNVGMAPFVATYSDTSVASLTPPPLAVGTHSITAQYSGDAHYTASASAPTVVTITPLNTVVTASTNGDPSYVTQPVVFAVTVGSSGAVATGTVALTTGSNGSTTLGTGTLDATGKTSITATFSAAGTITLYAYYAGDATHSSASFMLTQTVVPAFSLQPGTGGSTVTVASGQSASAQLSITGVAGYTGSVSLKCSGLPANVSCAFNPATLNVAGGMAQTSTMTIATNAAAAGIANPAMGNGLSTLSCGIFGGTMLLLLTLRRRSYWMAILLATLVILPIGCGGSSSTTGATSTATAGTYPFEVMATAGAIQSTTSYTLTIQ